MAGRVRLKGATSGFTEVQAADEAPENTVILPTGEGELIAVDKTTASAGELLEFDGTDWQTTSDISVNSIQFDTSTATEVSTEGELAWNSAEGTLDLMLEGAATALQLGQEVVYRVKNQTGSTIADGTAVGFAGTLGASGIILAAPFLADGSQPSEFFMGVATEDIPDGEDGYVTHFGRVRGIDLSSFSDGDILYASETTPGALRIGPPAAPNNIIQVAAVIKAHPNNGSLFVRPTIGSNIFKDEAVSATRAGMVNGDILRWNDSTDTFDSEALTTTGVAEGTNLYYTDARADARIAAATTDNLSEGSTNLYYTNGRVDAQTATNRAPLYFVENVVTANYTLALTDVAKVVAFNSASNLTLTVPANASVAFPIGTVINVYRAGTGTVTIAGASGVTVRNAGTIPSQFGERSLRKRDTNEWVLT